MYDAIIMYADGHIRELNGISEKMLLKECWANDVIDADIRYNEHNAIWHNRKFWDFLTWKGGR